MITPSFTILLKFPLVTGASHHDKATSGSLVVQGCDFRYLGTPHNASQHRTSRSLRTGADLYGGILTLGGHNANIVIFQRLLQVSWLLFFLSCASRHADDLYPAIELQGINDGCMRGSIVYSLFWFLSTGGGHETILCLGSVKYVLF